MRRSATQATLRIDSRGRESLRIPTIGTYNPGVGELSFGRVVFLLRNPMAGLPLALAIAIAIHSDAHLPSVWIAGSAIVIFGIGLRAWSGCFNTYGRGDPRRLATDGPYAAMRNPLYLGSALIIAGACLSAGSALVSGLALLWAIAVYHVVVLREESRLDLKHAEEYSVYFEKVPRWIPHRWPSFRPFVPLDRFRRALFTESAALLLLLPSLYLAAWS